MKPIDGLSFQLYSARMLEPLERQFELLAGLGYRRVEPFGGLLDDPARLKRAARPARHDGAELPCRPRSPARRRQSGDRGSAAISACARSLRRRRRSANATAARPSGARSARSWRTLGKAVNAEGLAFGWHNHNWEYQKAADGSVLSRPDVRRGAGPRSGRPISPGSRAAAPIRRPSSGATRAASSSCHIKDIAPPGNASTRTDGPIRAMACSTGPRCAPRCGRPACSLFVVEHDKPNDVARFARRAAANDCAAGRDRHGTARRRHHRLRHDLRHLHAEHDPLSRAAGSSPAPTFARTRRTPRPRSTASRRAASMRCWRAPTSTSWST